MTQYKGVGQLFDKGAADYDDLRRQLIPCFDEFYGTALGLVEDDLKKTNNDPPLIVDLGSGSGLLAEHILESQPHCRALLIDLSEEMLKKARIRFAGNAWVKYRVADYTDQSLVEPGSAQAVVSGLSIHHLSDEDKQRVFSQAFDWLCPGGIFVNADQVLGATPALEQQYRDIWLSQVSQAGVDQEQLEKALERMKADKMTPLAPQLDWLQKAGFQDFDCAYKNYSFAVLWGRKSAS